MQFNWNYWPKAYSLLINLVGRTICNSFFCISELIYLWSMLYIFILCFPFHCIYSFKHYTFYISIYCPGFRMTINFTHDKNSISCYAFKLIYLFIFFLKFRLSFLNQVGILVGVIKIARHLVPAVCWDTFHAVYSPAFTSLAFPYLSFPIAFLEHKKYNYSKHDIWLFF